MIKPDIISFRLDPNDRCMKTSEVARYLQISEKTLRTYRSDGLGPVYFKFDRMVRYRLSDVKKWRDSRIHNPVENSSAKTGTACEACENEFAH